MDKEPPKTMINKIVKFNNEVDNLVAKYREEKVTKECEMIPDAL